MIANSLSITIAQRTREFATLRTLGASRRQVLTSIVLEALVIGVARVDHRAPPRASRSRSGLFKLFDAVGFTLPNNGLVVQTRTIVVALLVGIARDAAREPAAGVPRDARAADRRRARRRDAPGLALRALPHARRARS